MPDDVERLYETVNGLRVGKALARVVANDDPQLPGWLLVEPVSASSDGEGSAAQQQSWARPCLPLCGPSSNFHMLPDVGALVWIDHVGGAEGETVWSGCDWPEQDGLNADDKDPQQKFLRIGEMELRFDERKSELVLSHGQTRLTLSANAIKLEATTIELTANGRTVKLDGSGFDALAGALKVT